MLLTLLYHRIGNNNHANNENIISQTRVKDSGLNYLAL